MRRERKRGVYRDGRVHVVKRMCDTCIFRPGNLMRLEPGRVEGLVAATVRADSCIPCHETTHGQGPGEAVCRGFFEKHATGPLQIADRLALMVFDELPAKG